MRLQLLAVGRLKDGPERVLCERYAARIHDGCRPLGFAGPDIVELAESRARRPEDRKVEEASSFRAKLPGGLLIALDERGRSMGSTDFAHRLARERDAGLAHASFLIGGADGLDPALREQCALALSFGALTLPHQLVRVLVLEQLYRALTILGGHPYHRV
jgi:23S rRNA (pseudouridine1915-N3)-methyltransferase